MCCIPLAFVWVEPQSCKWSGFRQGMHGENHTFNCHADITAKESAGTYWENNMVYRCSMWCVTNIFEVYSNQNSFVCVAVSYSDNSSACLSMLSSHDNWSSLQMPTHSSMMPLAHNSTSGTHSRFVYFLVVYLYQVNSSQRRWSEKGNTF